MKTFKTLHTTNKIFFFTTLVLYFTLYLGMIFQIVLGVTQILLAIFLLINFSKLNKTTKNRIKSYWIFVLISTIAMYFNHKYGNDIGNFIFIFLIPMLIATYFYYLTANINNDSFLNAKWKNLALINYNIDPKILEKHLPKGTEIDLYDGKCYVSLVGFLFQDTRLLGLKFPFYTNFEEVNLRFYVKRLENNEWKRGVVFIKEIVPKHALTLVANTIYKEHYQTLPIKHNISSSNETTDFVYQWKMNNRWNVINITTKNELLPIEEKTKSDFICEHYFGYTKYNSSTTFEYEVKHPRWEQYEVISSQIDVDFKNVYGDDFADLENKKPCSVIVAKGSEISVENKRKIK